MVTTDSSALLAHILSQTRQNIELLSSQNVISQTECREILAKLPTSPDASVAAITYQLQQPLISPPSSAVTNMASVPVQSVPQVRVPPPPPSQPAKRLFQARALWNYNEFSQDPSDLSFRAGDLIDVVEETNADWWTGTLNGHTALFPSNYVEKIQPTYNQASPPATSPTAAYYPEKAYPPPPQSHYVPPPAPYQNSYNSYQAPPPPAPTTVVVAPGPGPEPKKSKFGGKLGDTLAHSAVGGVGFGAGSAIGSGIIHSVF